MNIFKHQRIQDLVVSLLMVSTLLWEVGMKKKLLLKKETIKALSAEEMSKAGGADGAGALGGGGNPVPVSINSSGVSHYPSQYLVYNGGLNVYAGVQYANIGPLAVG
jgi:hypothetical protein